MKSTRSAWRRLAVFGVGAGILIAPETQAVPTAKPKRAKSSQKTSSRSQEWKSLPKQEWELVNLSVPAEVDKNGIDSRSRITFHKETGIELRSWVAPDRFEPFGEIIGARNDAQFLSLGDIVVIEKADLGKDQVVDWSIGQVYSVGGEAATFESDSSGRDAKVYPLLGRVRILGADPASEGERYFAQIIASKEPIPRESLILPSTERVKIEPPKPAKEVLKAHVKLPPKSPIVSFAQTDLVLIDRGTEDGLETGNVFRAYQTLDPSNKKKLTEANQLISADLLVVQVSQYFCTALVMRSRGALPDEFPVYSLTDVSDVQWKQEFLTPGVTPSSVDQDLDSLDKNAEKLTDAEKRELNQLETYKTPAVAPAPTAEAAAAAAPVEVDTELDDSKPEAAKADAIPSPAADAAPVPPPVEVSPSVATEATPPAPAADAAPSADPELD